MPTKKEMSSLMSKLRGYSVFGRLNTLMEITKNTKNPKKIPKSKRLEDLRSKLYKIKTKNLIDKKTVTKKRKISAIAQTPNTFLTKYFKL